jgi:hypothetical protein
MSTLGTAAYLAIARLAARHVAGLGFVRGVHARRSLASGDIAVGRSDIDLTIVLDPAESMATEVARVRGLARRLAVFRRILPVVGPPEVATASELAEWYRSPFFPASAERDRAWRCLWGESFERPAVATSGVAASADTPHAGELPWLFWAWLTLVDDYRRGKVRTCCNLLLDIVNVRYLCSGAFTGPQRRTEVLAHWSQVGPGRRPEHAAIAAALAGKWLGGDPRAFLRWVYAEALRVMEELYADLGPSVDGALAASEVRTRVPFGYRRRTYVLVDPHDEAAVDAALARMERDPDLVVTTAHAFELYLRHRNPWEYFAIDARDRGTLGTPPDAVLQRAIRYYLHRVVPRRIGFAIGSRVDRSQTLGPQYGQARLWLDHGVIAASRDDLVERYRHAYGAWPYQTTHSRDHYFTREYPLLCDAIDSLSGRLA